MSRTTPTDYGGYEFAFVEPPPDRCICNICHHPSREPFMTGECCQGQTICKSCLDQWQQIRGARVCPVCNKEGDFNSYPNYHIKREIKNLKVYCINKEKGCEWQDVLNDINNHLDGCQFGEVKCSNECGKMIERQFLTSHVETECPRRKVNCQYCHDIGEHQFIEGQHQEECPKLLLPCPNKCKAGSVPREDMEGHRKECPFEMIQCEYHNVGCEVSIARKDQKKHENDEMKEHLMMTKNELTDTKAQLSKALSSLMVLMNAQLSTSTITADIWPVHLDTIVTMFNLGNQLHMCPVTIKMEEYNGKKVNKEKWYSESFYTHNNGYKMCLRVDAAGDGDGEGTHLSWFLFLMKGSHDDQLTWPLKGKFLIKLLNQISDSEHYSMDINYNDNVPIEYKNKVTQDDKATGAWGQPEFISNKGLHTTTATCQYLKDDCLFFQVTKL